MDLDARLDVRIDDGVTFAFTVTNPTTERVDLVFPDGLVVDVTVLDGDREVWRWSEGRAFTQAVQRETLAPGESSVSTLTWDGATPGRYRAVATLAAQGIDARTAKAFEVRDD